MVRVLIHGYITAALELAIENTAFLMYEMMCCCLPCSRGPEGAGVPSEPRTKTKRSTDELPQPVDIRLQPQSLLVGICHTRDTGKHTALT